MSGIKPLASLGAGLVARRAALRRVPLTFAAQADEAVTDDGPEVRRQIAQLGESIAALTFGSPAHEEPAGPVRRIAFTLRLDAARHARLRETALREGDSAQAVLTRALDTYLAQSSCLSTGTKP